MSKQQRRIELIPYQSNWVEEFASEAEKIRKIIKGNCLDIDHIGSTAIPNIYAKPIIDILVTVKDINSIDLQNTEFIKLNYTPLGEYGIKNRRFFTKGESPRTHHLHIFQHGSSEIKRHIAFRDYLIAHPNTAQAYSAIKLSLAEQFRNQISSYVNGKESFIRMIDHAAGQPRQDQIQAHDKIEIVEYQQDWPKLAIAEINAIKKCVPLPFVKIEHLGSTSIKGMTAKPIIDLYIAVDDIYCAEQWIQPLRHLGYVFWDENPNKKHLRFFKGMPPYGIRRTHHLHILPYNNKFKQKVDFCRILNNNPDRLTAYTQLKKSLAIQHPNDRDAYTKAKSDFIESTLRENTSPD